MLAVSLVTLGSPEQLTGGYLYHRRMAELAPRHGAHVDLLAVPALPFPLPAIRAGRVLGRAAQADVLVVDSIAAAFVAPWHLFRRPSDGVAAVTTAGRHAPPATRRHRSPAGSADAVQAALDRALYRRCDLLMLASETLTAEMSGYPTVVVAPGRDVAAAPSGPPIDLRQGRQAALLSVGNWVARKGTLDLLDAFGRLPPGPGDAAPGRPHRRRPQVRIPGPRPPAPSGPGSVGSSCTGPSRGARWPMFYRSADVFVLPSYREPYGTVYGEAMAAGLPVVGWRAGNLPQPRPGRP